MEIDLIVPETLNEIPLCRYQEFVEMQKNSNDKQFIANKMIQIFCGVKLKDVLNMKLTHLNELVVHFAKIFKEEPRLIRRFKIKDVEFGFIPSLEDITFGEYVDIENYLTDWKTYHKAMAVMYRPIIEKHKDTYDIMPYDSSYDMQELMKFAPLDVAISSSVFFWTLGKELLVGLTNYLEKELQTMTKSQTTQQEGSSENNGVGIQVSMQLLKETLQSSMRLPTWDLLNVSPISHLKSKKQKSKTKKLNKQ